MKKKIVVAVDGSAPSNQAVRYAADIGKKIGDLDFVLLHVLPQISQILMDEARTDMSVRREIDRIVVKNRKAADSIVEDQKSRMIDHGIDGSRITSSVIEHREGIAKDILEFAQSGRYDAIVIGRRGVSRLKTVFMGSVTANLLENSKFLPVWVVDGSVSFGSVLVAVDGSESALRAVSHLAFILGGDTDVRITLFHATPRFTAACPIDTGEVDSALEAIGERGNQHCIDRFQHKAMETFQSAGIPEDRVSLKIAKRVLSPGRAIIEQAEAGSHDTVVIGRRGLSRSFFTGSVSRHVMDRAAHCALWVVS
ncbi:MAG: universal stress protein [Desulfobacterales bacterium]